MGGGSDKLSSKMCKAPVKSFTTNKPTASFFTGQMCFLWPNQQCQSTVACLQSQMKTKLYKKCLHALSLANWWLEQMCGINSHQLHKYNIHVIIGQSESMLCLVFPLQKAKLWFRVHLPV